MLNAGISLRTTKVDTDLHAISIPDTVIMEMCTKNKAFYEYFLANFSSNIFDKSIDAITWTVQARLFLSDVVPFTFLSEEEIDCAAQVTLTHIPTREEPSPLFRARHASAICTCFKKVLRSGIMRKKAPRKCGICCPKAICTAVFPCS